MRIFNVVDFLVYVENNDGIYFNESYGEIKKIVKDNGDGVYSLYEWWLGWKFIR